MQIGTGTGTVPPVRYLLFSFKTWFLPDRSHFSTDPDGMRTLGSVLWLTDPDPDPALFVSDLQDTKKYFFLRLSFLSYICIKDKKVIEKSQNRRNQGFSLFSFYLLREGFGSGSVQINYGSGCGSRRLKNIQIRNTTVVFN